MSLEIFPTYPKIRAEQLDLVDWAAVNALMTLINTGDANAISVAVSQALSFSNLDPAVSNALGQANSQSSNAVKGIITASYLDPLVANNINTSGTQTRTAIDALLATVGWTLGGTINIGEVDWNTLTQSRVYLGLGTGTGGANVPPWPTGETAMVLIVSAGSRVAQALIGPYTRVFRLYDGVSWTYWHFSTLRSLRSTLGSNTMLSNSSTSPTTLFSINPYTTLPLLAYPTMISRLIVSVNIAIEATSSTSLGATGIRIKWGSSVIASMPIQTSGDLSTTPNSATLTASIPITDTPNNLITVEAYDTRTSVKALATWWGGPATQISVMFI